MIPLSLTLRNFMSYRTETTVDFSEVTLACLSGDNGAGKSALLDAMTWAIWGKCRSSNDRHIISIGETQMEVTYVFRLGQRDYRVFRRRTLTASTSRQTLEFDSRPAGDDIWTSITGDSVSDTQQRITNTVKMDYETFIASSFLMQGKADTFTAKTASERKRILGEILNLGDYDELAQMANRAANDSKSRLEVLRQQIQAIEERLAGREQFESRLNEVEKGLAAAGEKIAGAYTELEGLVARLQTFEAISRARQGSAERLERNASKRQELAARMERDRSERAELEKIASREQEISAGYNRLMTARATLQQLNDALQQRQPLEHRLSAARSRYQHEENQVVRDIDRLESQLATFDRQLDEVERSRLELERLEAEARTIEPELKKLDQHLEAQLQHEQAIARLESENERLRADMATIKQRMEALDEGDATCPVCRKPLVDGDHEHIRSEWHAEGKRLGDRFRANREAIGEHRASLDRLKNEISGLTDLRNRHLGQTQVIERLREQVKLEPDLVRGRDEARHELERLRKVRESGDFATGLREEIATLEAQVREIEYDPDTHQQARRDVTELERFESEYRALEESRLKLQMVVARIDENEMGLAALDEDIRRDQDDIAAYDEQLAGVDETRARHSALKDQINTLEQERDSALAERGSLLAQLKELDRQSERRRDLQDEEKRVAADQDTYRELALAFGRNGIQAMVIETMLPELQEEANDLLQRMSTGHLAVEFHTTRQALTVDSTIETLDIIIRDEFGERPYDLFSGGEAFRVNFAIRVALSKLLARRAGTTVDMLVIDEGFGTQDSRGRDGLVEALRSVENDFSSILVITHIDEIRDMFPARLDVVKTPDGSRVTLM